MNHSRNRTLASCIHVALLAASPLLGCAGMDGAILDEEAVGEVGQAESLPAATCQEIKAEHPSLTDGAYTLHLNNDPALPWIVYCANMDTAPAEYLELEVVGGSANFSSYPKGPSQSGTDVTTHYTRVRIDPATLDVDISDQTYSTSTGEHNHGSTQVTSMPFGVAMSCDGSPSGAANIDLTGTPFAVAANEFQNGGTGSSGGTSTYSSDNQIVDIAGGGYCGWRVSSPGLYNPFNAKGDFQLQLEYRRPASCADIKASVSNAWDSHYTLFVDRDAAKPWTAYCADMSGTPAEYLTLTNVGGSANFSSYPKGPTQSGTDVTTHYTRVRIDPVTLDVDISDQTYSTSTGQHNHGSTQVTSMPFGVAMSCDGSPSGAANIDLTGTPVAVAANEFQNGGTGSSGGTSTYSSGDQIVDIAGGGFCGWRVSSPGLFNPFNAKGDFQLALVYGP